MDWFWKMIHQILGDDPVREHNFRAAYAYNELEYAPMKLLSGHRRSRRERLARQMAHRSRLLNSSRKGYKNSH